MAYWWTTHLVPGTFIPVSMFSLAGFALENHRATDVAVQKRSKGTQLFGAKGHSFFDRGTG